MNKKIKDKKRNNPNSFGCNNSSITNTSRNKYKSSIRRQWVNKKIKRCKKAI